MSLAVGVSVGVPSGAAQNPPPAPPPSVLDDLPEYYIGAGDVLHIAVWKEPDLTADVFVRLDGRITVPLAGGIQAAGRTTDELAVEIRQKMRAFLEVPQVTVTVSQAVSARFYVIGEVGTSGAFPLTGRITIVQALALAGGFREFAKRDRIVLLRERRGERKAIPFNFRDLEAGSNLEKNIPLQSGDTVIVP